MEGIILTSISLLMYNNKTEECSESKVMTHSHLKGSQSTIMSTSDVDIMEERSDVLLKTSNINSKLRHMKFNLISSIDGRKPPVFYSMNDVNTQGKKNKEGACNLGPKGSFSPEKRNPIVKTIQHLGDDAIDENKEDSIEFESESAGMEFEFKEDESSSLFSYSSTRNLKTTHFSFE